MHVATLPTGIIGYIENPITTVKPSHYRIFDLLLHLLIRYFKRSFLK